METTDIHFNFIEPSGLSGPRIYFTEPDPDRTSKHTVFEVDFELIFIGSWGEVKRMFEK